MLSTYLSARSSAAEGIKLVGTATAVTTGSRGLEARVRTESHVRSGKPAKCLLSRKTAEQEHGGKQKKNFKKKKNHSCGLLSNMLCLPKTPPVDSHEQKVEEKCALMFAR